MDTARVDIVYRPLRIAFAVHSNDRVSFRKAVRLCYAFWGGRYNPIVLVDRPTAGALIELFRPDFIYAIGDEQAVKEFAKAYPYLMSPNFQPNLFFDPKDVTYGCRAKVLDIQNLLTHNRDDVDWKAFVQAGVRIFEWDDADPLADALLIQCGGYPDPAEVGVDYAESLATATTAISLPIELGTELPIAIAKHGGIAFVSRFGLRQHYSRPTRGGRVGFFLGDANDIDDLTNFWNLRAANIALVFIDVNEFQRFNSVLKETEAQFRADLAGLGPRRDTPTVWSAPKLFDAASQLFGKTFTFSIVQPQTWNGENVIPPTMHFGDETSLGVLGQAGPSSHRVSFAISDKPYAADPFFRSQLLVASIDLIADESSQVFVPPYLPELNEFAGRQMISDHRRIRLESGRLGIVIDATTRDQTVRALPTSALLERIFAMAGYKSQLSGSGLITRQLIARMGGLGGVRAFKIPGVRRLLKTFDPMQSFSRKAALSLIGGADPDNLDAKFADHTDLFIEKRPTDVSLTPAMVFEHLVAKGLFRIGFDLECPTCALSSWTPIDSVRQSMTCTLCGADYDATRQLVDRPSAYRRSGVLGLEKNTLGAVPVATLLQQLSVNFFLGSYKMHFGTSYDLSPADATSGLPTCETDFVVVSGSLQSDKVVVLIGECKDRAGKIDSDDFENLRQVADAFPASRFAVFMVFAKLGPFNLDEIEGAKELNAKWGKRVILMTHRELEPYHIYDRTNKELGLELHGSTPDELADATDLLYFEPAPN